jgi:uncharacterized membrane protein
MAKKYTSPKYYPEIDIIRGLAVVAMVLFHTAFQLRFIFNKPIISSAWFWIGSPMLISGTFLTVAGISLYIGVQKGKYNRISQLLQRSGRILGLGMCLTLLTSVAHAYLGGYVYFGILHCIGLATFISYYTISWPKYVNLLAGLLTIGIGIYGRFVYLPRKCIYLFWLYPCFANGLDNQIDYYPLIPSIGFVFMGIFLGKVLYPAGQRAFNYTMPRTLLKLTTPIYFLGRHALLLYCIHTPIVFAIIYLILYLMNTASASTP